MTCSGLTIMNQNAMPNDQRPHSAARLRHCARDSVRARRHVDETALRAFVDGRSTKEFILSFRADRPVKQRR